MKNVMTSLFQQFTSYSSVAIFQHHQRMEFTFHNSYVILTVLSSVISGQNRRLIRNRNCLSLASTCVHPGCLVESVLLIVLGFCVVNCGFLFFGVFCVFFFFFFFVVVLFCFLFVCLFVFCLRLVSCMPVVACVLIAPSFYKRNNSIANQIKKNKKTKQMLTHLILHRKLIIQLYDPAKNIT